MNKKVVIERVAFIEKCGCGLHGHIKFPDGSCSLEFYTRTDGLEILKEGLRNGLMEEDEADVLAREIKDKEWEFFDDILLPQLRAIINTLQATRHPPAVIEQILTMIFDIGDQLFDEYFPEDMAFGAEKNTREDRRVLDS